jgi:hypothetical protein
MLVLFISGCANTMSRQSALLKADLIFIGKPVFDRTEQVNRVFHGNLTVEEWDFYKVHALQHNGDPPLIEMTPDIRYCNIDKACNELN